MLRETSERAGRRFLWERQPGEGRAGQGIAAFVLSLIDYVTFFKVKCNQKHAGSAPRREGNVSSDKWLRWGQS